MAITKLTTDLNIVSALADLPNATSGLTAAQLKAKFDEGPNGIKTYINDTLTVELDTQIALGGAALTAHKLSGDHDGRYYTEAESDAKFETITDLTTNRKLSATGDFTGTLNGLPIVAADPGLSSTVAGHTAQLADLVLPAKSLNFKSDGTDNSSALLTMATNASITKKMIHFPAGTYQFSDAQLVIFDVLNGVDEFTIIGAGIGKTIFKGINTKFIGLKNITIVNIELQEVNRPFSFSGCENVLIEDLKSTSTLTAVASRTITTYNCKKFKIKRCQFFNMQYPIFIQDQYFDTPTYKTRFSGINNQDFVIDDIYAENTRATFDYPAGVNICSGINIKVINSTFKNFLPSVGTIGYVGVYQGDNVEQEARNCTVDVCTSYVDSQTYTPMYTHRFHNMSDVVIKGCTSNITQDSFVTFDGDNPIASAYDMQQNASIIGNIANGRIQFIRKFRNASVSGNTITDAGYGVYIYSVDGVYQPTDINIDGNTFSRIGNSGACLRYGQEIKLSDNRFVDCNTLNNASGNDFKNACISVYLANHIHITENNFRNTGIGHAKYAISNQSATLYQHVHIGDNIIDAMEVSDYFNGYTAAPTIGTWELGYVRKNTNIFAGSVMGWACNKSGTFDSISTTCTADGSAVVTVASATGLKVGQYVKVNGGSDLKVIGINGTQVTLNGTVGAGSGLSFVNSAPTFAATGNYGYRSYTASPVSVKTPDYISEMIFDTTNKNWWMATGLTSADWKQISN